MRIRKVAHAVAPLQRDLPAAESADESADHIEERYRARCVRCHKAIEFEATAADRKAGWDDKVTLLRVSHKWSHFRMSGGCGRDGWICPACADEVMRCLEGEV